MAVMSIHELVMMNDPKISMYEQPLTMDDRNSLLPMSFKEFDYVIAIYLEVYKNNDKDPDADADDKNEFWNEYPPEVGFLKAVLVHEENDENRTYLDLVDCN